MASFVDGRAADLGVSITRVPAGADSVPDVF